MSKVYFMNNGNFDVRAMMTMGLSAKEGDGAIGFFGTGFKYAVAIVLRHGGSIKISTVSGMYEFTCKREIVRGKEFGIVYMNDREAGFTTHLGANWLAWMAYRELYCNAKDEGGETSTQISADYDTVIEVDCAAIYKAHDKASDYFLMGEPIWKGEQAEIFSGSRPYIYYRGIAVKAAPENSLFSYNITSTVDLTEDRTAAYDHQLAWPIKKAIQRCTDSVMLRKIIKRGEHGESKMAYDKDFGASDEFVSVCGELMNSNAGLCEGARLLVFDLQKESASWPEFELTKVQAMMLEKAKSFLAMLDVDVDRYPIKTVVGLGDGVMGRALDDVIYLSEIPFDLGTKQVASTLMEEWVHNKYGCDDFDRRMQSWLFDKILSLGENINGQPI